MSDQTNLSGVRGAEAPPYSGPLVDKHDCGCGCGGTGDCSKAAAIITRREGRRKFLVGGIGVTAFAATFASRPALAQTCNNLTALYSPSGSQSNAGVCNSSGMTPGFWMNHGPSWPSGISPSSNFSDFFIGFSPPGFPSGSLQTALCPPNGDNFAFQLAGALINAQSPNTNSSFGYGSASALAQAVEAAYNALNAIQPPLGNTMIWQMIHDRLASMNKNTGNSNASWIHQGNICPSKN